MYKIFIDDSGQKDYKHPYSSEHKASLPPWDDAHRDFLRGNFFVLCGLHIRKTDIRVIDERIKTLKRETFWTEHVEIKSTRLRRREDRKKYYIDPYNIPEDSVIAFGEELFRIIHEHRETLKIIAVVFDKRQYSNRLSPERNPLLKSTQVLFERIHYSRKKTLVVFDQMESSLRKEKGMHGKILKVLLSNDGMEHSYVDGYSNIIDIEFQESKNENLLQLADICAYTVHKQFMEYGKGWLERGETCKIYDYFNRIRCNFHHNHGKVIGCGLVLVPDFIKPKWDLLAGCNGS